MFNDSFSWLGGFELGVKTKILLGNLGYFVEMLAVNKAEVPVFFHGVVGSKNPEGCVISFAQKNISLLEIWRRGVISIARKVSP